MAGLDYMYDACGCIQKYISERIWELLEMSMNEYQDPNWVQAAELFQRSVLPCSDYNKDYFRELAREIVKKAKRNNNRFYFSAIPGMYNHKVINFEKTLNIPEGVTFIDYENLIQEIKEWINAE